LYHREGRFSPYDPCVTLGNWLSFTFCLVVIVASTAYCAARGWRAWRAFGSTSGVLGDALDEVSAAGEAAERKALSLSSGTERLAAATDRLNRSLAELAVLRRAAGEPRALLASIRGLMPRK
jgi:hypothetical protein